MVPCSFHVSRLSGVQRANYVLGVLTERPYTPLHSELYDELGLQFSVLIVDESHLVKRDTTLLNREICSLSYGVVFLLTGTPIFNTWRDLAGQLMLLPGGGPFDNLDHMTELIRVGLPARHGEQSAVRVDDAGGHCRLLFNNLLAGLIIARPKSQLDINTFLTHR
ncbi:hypothetical protein ACHAQI_012279 [Fusarium lateritium]